MDYLKAWQERAGLLKATGELRQQAARFHGRRGAPGLDQFFDIVFDATYFAEVYFWSKPLCHLVDQVSRQARRPFVFHPTDFPSRTGFIYFDAPLRTDYTLPDQYLDTPPGFEGLLWSVFERSEGFQITLCTRAKRNLLMPFISYPFKFSDSDNFDGFEPRQVETFIAHSFPIAQTCLTFLRQKLLTRQRRDIPRGLRRQNPDPQRPDTLYDVTLLRKREHQPTEGHLDVEWSCRWLVTGHWRQQYYPSDQTHRPVWISPYVKGPDDKPLKEPAARLFAVVR